MPDGYFVSPTVFAGTSGILSWEKQMTELCNYRQEFGAVGQNARRLAVGKYHRDDLAAETMSLIYFVVRNHVKRD